MRGGAGGAGLGALLVVGGVDAGDAAQPVHSVLPDADAVLEVEFVGDEPVAQGGVVGVDLVDQVEQVGAVPVALGYGVVEPFVVPGPGQAEDPQRHRDRHPDVGAGRGHLSDEREDYFPGRLAWDR